MRLGDKKMKRYFLLAIIPILLAGCVESGPMISKSNMGNLEINVIGPANADIRNAEIYIDGIFIGNFSDVKPIIYVKRGQRVVKVIANGYKAYEKTIMILGEPNQQVINAYLEPM